MYYYKVTRGDHLNTEEAKLNFIKSWQCRNYQYEYLRTNATTFMENDSQSEHEAVKHLLAQYSFIGMHERPEDPTLSNLADDGLGRHVAGWQCRGGRDV